jgi:stage III sporulation protein AD
MGLSKIIFVSLAATIFSVLLKKEKPEFSILVSIAAGIIILWQVIPFAISAVNEVYMAASKLNINNDYIKTMLKIVGIAYITQYSAELCKDADERALAAKLEMAGKIILLGTILPIASALFDTIAKIIP